MYLYLWPPLCIMLNIGMRAKRFVKVLLKFLIVCYLSLKCIFPKKQIRTGFSKENDREILIHSIEHYSHVSKISFCVCIYLCIQ